MKAVRLTLAVCVLTVLLFSCKKENATVQFRNRSVTNSTYTIIWDGNAITTLGPQQDSEEFDFPVGKHTLQFVISNTGEIGCTPSDPVLDGGYIHKFTCSQ